MNWRVRKSDDRGVTALEYVSIIGFIAAMVMPAAYMAAQALWGSNGAVAPLQTYSVGRGPYQGPDGPVPGSSAYVTISGNPGLQFNDITAHNGNLFFEVSAYDTIKNVRGQIVSMPFVPNTWQAMYIPQAQTTIFLTGKLAGGTMANMPSGSVIGTYPNTSNYMWSCGC